MILIFSSKPRNHRNSVLMSHPLFATQRLFQADLQAPPLLLIPSERSIENLVHYLLDGGTL